MGRPSHPTCDWDLESQQVNDDVQAGRLGPGPEELLYRLSSVVLEPDGEEDREQAGIASAISSAVQASNKERSLTDVGPGADRTIQGAVLTLPQNYTF